MAKKGHVTIGAQGQHEFYAPTTGQGQKNRRNRKDCRHYDSETKYCERLRTSCVGPTLCGKFTRQKRQGGCTNKQSPPNCLETGTIVHSRYLGDGIIISLDGEMCTIEFKGIRLQRKTKELFKDFQFTTKGTE